MYFSLPHGGHPMQKYYIQVCILLSEVGLKLQRWSYNMYIDYTYICIFVLQNLANLCLNSKSNILGFVQSRVWDKTRLVIQSVNLGRNPNLVLSSLQFSSMYCTYIQNRIYIASSSLNALLYTLNLGAELLTVRVVQPVPIYEVI